MVCTFFGHRDASDSLTDELRKVLIELIVAGNVDVFYIGNSGNFDRLVSSVLYELSSEYSFTCQIVLSYLPEQEREYNFDTILPEGIEEVPRRFAISYRNQWMIEQSDIVVTYVKRNYGGAYKYKELAKKKGKKVIEV
ncbi:MAG: hypothetical protein J6A49_09940 [Clostridia bacterium]|nr:hypothetical protein [Clostridia bacterium]